MRNWKTMIPLGLALALLAGCGQTADNPGDQPVTNDNENPTYIESEITYVDKVVLGTEVELQDEAVALAEAPFPALSTMLLPEASGTAVQTNEKATIDYSNIADGYVMVNYTAATANRLRVQVVGPSYEVDQTVYTYELPAGEWTTYPLSDGNGSYKVTVYENTTDNRYATVVSASFEVALKDEFAPFTLPNQYVDYSNSPNTIAKAAEVVGDETDPLKKVEKVYDYVVNNLTYDKDKAATVQTGYLPVLDSVLAEQKGICFDYAALMAGMLRSQGVPCKLVVGYAGTAYHAWVSVWTEDGGWIDGVIFFDGSAWQRMDPTFASSSNSSNAVMQYIGDGENYSPKYLY